MKNRNYRVCRDDIYVGEVTKVSRLDRCTESIPLYRVKSGDLVSNRVRFYRNMFFVPTEDKLPTDLMYDSPSYPILNMTDNEKCLSVEDGIVIEKSYNLGNLLEFLGYRKELSYRDVARLQALFSMGKCAISEAERVLSQSAFYSILEVQRKIELLRKFKIAVDNNRSLLDNINEGLNLSEETDCLEQELDEVVFDALALYGYSDNFTPSLEEGHITKL